MATAFLPFTISIATQFGKERFDVAHIVRIDGRSNYSLFTMQCGRKILSAYTLGFYKNKLPPQFIRIHKGCLINIKYIKNISRTTASVLLLDGTTTPLSYRRLPRLVLDKDFAFLMSNS